MITSPRHRHRRAAQNARRTRHAIAAAILSIAVMLTYASAAGAEAGTFGPSAFGVYSLESLFENSDHSPATQAGSHPYAYTTTIVLNHTLASEEEQEACRENLTTEESECVPSGLFAPFGLHTYGDPKDLEVNLPAGFVANPRATGVKCTEHQLEERPAFGGGCPLGSAVGVIGVELEFFGELRTAIYNMQPPPGVPAELAFNIAGIGIIGHIVGKVRSASDYGVTGSTLDIAQTKPLFEIRATLWGDPADASHDSERGKCANQGQVHKGLEERTFEEEGQKKTKSERKPEGAYFFNCPLEEGKPHVPLLTLPGSCTGTPLETTLTLDSWQRPETVLDPANSSNMTATAPPATGCEKLHFDPSLSIQPEPQSAAADSPTGLNVELKIPHEENVNGLAESNLKEAVVKLPAGMTVSPSAANGLGACSLEQIGLTNANPASCPGSSRLGTVEITTQLLEHPLKGSVFLAEQGNLAGNGSNPFGSLLALYLVAEGQGVVVKLPGTIELDEEGALTARFGKDPATGQYLPQLPFEDLEMNFPGGPAAPLITPPACGTYTTTSQLIPWSGSPPAEPSSSFTVEQGCATGAFNPSFTAGTTNNHAGGSSPFTVTVSRKDGERRLAGIELTTPPGLLADLKDVPECPEPQASSGACPPESEIGETSAAAGPGTSPYWVRGGKVYLTAPYAGAPFGLSIVVPAVAGPFNLGVAGAPIIVRARIDVDPRTAQVTVTSDPLPRILQGVPLDLRTVNVTVNRAGFMLNPTSCSPLSITANIGSVQGASATVSDPFQAANCAALKFQPKLTVTATGKASRLSGAGLKFKIAYPKNAMGSQAWFDEAKFELPKQLPARLHTIQQACLAATFEQHRGACPAHSIIGHAVVHTPVLPVPLEGPVYFVSYGGAAFPDAVLVLDGYGVHIELHGNTFIDKKTGVTSATFKNTPDVPFESIEVSLPAGPYSEFGANLPHQSYDFCGRRLTMPTLFKAQNGLQISQATPIALTGCATTKTRVQLLKAALGACHRKHGQKRADCEHAARARYASTAKRGQTQPHKH